jgi:hypothetical protein
LVESVLSASAVNVDETGWFTAHEPRTLWTAVTSWAAIFRVAEDRHRDRLEELIGPQFKGILGSDRWWAYAHIDPESRQACWEHIKRDFHRHSEGLAEQKEFGTAGLELTKRLFKTWRSFQGHQDRERLIGEMQPIQDELRVLLERAARKSKRTRLHRRFANNLLKIWPALFTFVTVESVEPTNNAAERALRGPVIHRKLSHGTQSEDGETFSNAPCPPRSPAASNTAPCSPTCANYSPPTPAATHSQHSPEQGLNAYTFVEDGDSRLIPPPILTVTSRRRWPAKHDTILVYVRDPSAYHFGSEAVDREPYMAPGLVTAEKAARGKLPTDVWWHTIVLTRSAEKTGYPTLKPEGIVRRMVCASTRPGDWCLDFFAGSGTLGAVAAKLGRRYVLIDSSLRAVEVMRARLLVADSRWGT